MSYFPTAVFALEKIGPAVVPALAAALNHPNDRVRWNAASTLGRVGPDAAEAVPALITALTDPDDHVRWSAAFALERIRPDAAEAVPALAAALNDPNPIVRDRAARANKKYVLPKNLELRKRGDEV